MAWMRILAIVMASRGERSLRRAIKALLIEERSSSSQVKAAPAIRAAMSPSNVSLALLRGRR